MDGTGQPADERRDWMGLLARAEARALDRLWRGLELAPGFAWLRPPETGTVMLRGRAGAVGAPFNLGEMTVTRASLRLDCGAVGHAWVQGRDRSKARIAATVDALMQTEAAETIRAGLLAPLQQAEAGRRAARAATAAGTQVEFFTMVRGEE
ncbi:MAG: phosphonate C-P lyase system protein PhnG [Rubellimicrobium sp.]|nr:phosphonate C-P lyase system protein PhnG [Rubellimicrobium sp.]